MSISHTCDHSITKPRFHVVAATCIAAVMAGTGCVGQGEDDTVEYSATVTGLDGEREFVVQLTSTNAVPQHRLDELVDTLAIRPVSTAMRDHGLTMQADEGLALDPDYPLVAVRLTPVDSDLDPDDFGYEWPSSFVPTQRAGVLFLGDLDQLAAMESETHAAARDDESSIGSERHALSARIYWWGVRFYLNKREGCGAAAGSAAIVGSMAGFLPFPYNLILPAHVAANSGLILANIGTKGVRVDFNIWLGGNITGVSRRGSPSSC